MALWYRTRASRVRRPSIGEDRLGQLWASTVRCTGADPQLAWITSQRKTDRRSTTFIKCLRFIGSPFDGEPLFRACGPPEAGQLRWSCTPWEASTQVLVASEVSARRERPETALSQSVQLRRSCRTFESLIRSWSWNWNWQRRQRPHP